MNTTAGSHIWNFSGEILASSPVLYNDVVYFGTWDGNVYALNATNGSLIWNYTTGGAINTGSPALYNNVIYIGSTDNKLHAINATTGSEVWNYTTGGNVDISPAVKDDVVYFGSDDNKIYAANATTGSLLWNYTTSGDITSSPVLTNDWGYVQGIKSLSPSEGYIHILSINNTSEIAYVFGYQLGGYAIDTSPAITDEFIYFTDNSGVLYAFYSCDEVWVCTDWETCTNGIQSRTCTDANACSNATTSLRPDLSQSCTVQEESGAISTSAPSQSVSVPSIDSGSGGIVRINNPKIDLRNITIFPKTNIRNASLNVQQNSSKNITDLAVPFGTLYQAFSITTQAIENKDLNNISLEFRVNKTWLNENNYSYNDVVLYRVPNETSLWEKLSTVSVSEDDMYYYFLAISPGFSVFVIVASETAPCTPSQTRCFNNEVQLCSENSVWTAKETCVETCRNRQCVEERKMLITSAVFYTALVLMVSAAIIAVFLKLRYLTKKKTKRIK